MQPGCWEALCHPPALGDRSQPPLGQAFLPAFIISSFPTPRHPREEASKSQSVSVSTLFGYCTESK